MGLHHPLADKLPHLGEVIGKKPQEMDQRDRNMFSSQSNELQLSCPGHVFRRGGRAHWKGEDGGSRLHICKKAMKRHQHCLTCLKFRKWLPHETPLGFNRRAK